MEIHWSKCVDVFTEGKMETKVARRPSSPRCAVVPGHHLRPGPGAAVMVEQLAPQQEERGRFGGLRPAARGAAGDAEAHEFGYRSEKEGGGAL